MAILENLFAQQIVEKLGWTLIHFVWQGAVIALVLAILLMLLRKSTANLRYVIACGALALIVVLPVITMQLVTVPASQPAPDIEPVPAHTPAVLPVEETKEFPASETVVVDEARPIGSTVAAPTISWKERFVAALEPALPYIVLGWLVGVFGLSVWHLGGWTQLQKLRRKMVKPVDASVRSKLKDLAELLGIHRAVQVMKSALVQVPTVVGWLKPMILLPASSLTGLSPEQFEAILAHELAHIKRCDYLVNILQTVVEILGFYHPAVWWVSHKIRVERENCCDDLAVSVSEPERYARALTSMEEIRGVRPQLAVAASGGSLLERIRRLVGKDSVQEGRTGWAPSVISLLLIVTLAVSTTLALTAGKASEKMDVETILEKVRKAQRPAENMRIEWVSESGPGGFMSFRPVSPEKQIRLTRYTGSAVISGVRSRIEERQETYYGKDVKPGSIVDKTYVFDGTEQRKLETRVKGSRTKAGLWLTDVSQQLLRKRLFGGLRPPIHNEERLKEYKLTLTRGEEPGRFILDAFAPKAGLYRLTIDADRGYNVIKKECLRSDGSKAYEDNFKPKRYRDGIWFISEWEEVRFGRKEGTKPRVEERVTISNVELNSSVRDEDIFKLQFPEGTMVADLSFNYNRHTDFLVGCLSETKHTQEDSAATAILNQPVVSGAREDPGEVFGPVRERLINSIQHRKDCFIDFDTARLMPVPEGFHLNTKEEKWLEEKSVDARVETDDGLCGLWTFNTVVIPVSSERWDSITPAACHRVFDKAKGIYPPIMSAEGKLPATFLFQTWDNRGIIQILEVQKDTEPRSIKVRYKLIEEAAQPEARSDMDVETILQKVRKAQRPVENMRIEWVTESGPGGFRSRRPVSPEKQIRLTRYTGSAVISGLGSRIEERQETYYGKDVNEPGNIIDKTYVFDGTEQRRLEKRTRGFRNRRTDGVIGLMEYNSSFLIDRLFDDTPLLRGKLWLEQYKFKLELLESDVPGIYVVKVTEREGHSYDLITVDGNRGYNIVKRQLTRASNGSVDYEDNFKLKKYPSGTWFVSGFERIRHKSKGPKTERRVEKKMTITNVQFDMPVPDGETFKLRFSEGTAVRDRTFDYRSSSELAVGSLSEPTHTQEDATVTAILEQAAREKTAGKDEVFGQVSERTINSIEGRKDCFIDFDTARLTSVPEKFHLNMESKKWFEDNSIDAKVETDDGLCGLWTFNTIVIPVSSERWDSITPAGCHRVFDKAKGIEPPIMSAEGKLPATFLFQTWDNRGILQILEVRKDTEPRSIKVRYKMIEEAA